HMMFATLDDLAGSVELLVFGKALGEHEAALAADEIVLVKGRVDHKEAGKTCVVVQTVERFAPSLEEIERARSQARAADREATTLAQPLSLRVAATDLCTELFEDLKQIFEEFKGPAEVVIEIGLEDEGRCRRLLLGERYRVNNTASARAELASAVERFKRFAPAEPALARAAAS
ncbi:MAG TPA: hypothetical protein VK765_02030, partial [Solirubrobacteraceae bacterium]|nr:hypothetical protein [Solirubrobacteraceae bacterium]